MKNFDIFIPLSIREGTSRVSYCVGIDSAKGHGSGLNVLNVSQNFLSSLEIKNTLYLLYFLLYKG